MKNLIKFKGFKDFDWLTIELADGRVVKGWFTCCRVNPDDVPKGFHKYGIREDDNGEGNFCEMHPTIWVNHAGDFITEEEIDCGNGLDIKDWNFDIWDEEYYKSIGGDMKYFKK